MYRRNPQLVKGTSTDRRARETRVVVGSEERVVFSIRNRKCFQFSSFFVFFFKNTHSSSRYVCGRAGGGGGVPLKSSMT